MILELNGTKVTIVDKTLGYQGDNLVNTIRVTVDKDSTWNYKLDMYKGKSKCFDSVVMTRDGNVCTVELTDEILSYGGRYTFQLRGYTDTQTYHSEIFEAWVNASIEYQCECKQADCGCDCKLPTEFYQIEDNVTEINNHPPYPGDAGKWMIWDVSKHEYVESDIEVSGGGGAVWVAFTFDKEGNITADKTNAEIYESFSAGMMVYGAIYPSNGGAEIRPLASVTETSAVFEFVLYNHVGYVEGVNDQWTLNAFSIQSIENKTTSITVDSTDTQYPSAKAVYNYGQSIAESAGKIDAITVNGTAQTVEDKTAKIVVNKSTVGLGNVDNTSDANKPVSTAQATAIADAKKAGTDAQTNLTAHIDDKDNPHEVTKAQVGLGDVDNTADKDKPISTATQTALNGKLDKTAVVDVTADAVKGQAADAKSVYDSLPTLKTWTSADVEDAT